MTPMGSEHQSKSPRKPRVSKVGDAKSDAIRAKAARGVAPDLAGLAAAWEDLPPAVRVGIAAMIKASCGP